MPTRSLVEPSALRMFIPNMRMTFKVCSLGLINRSRAPRRVVPAMEALTLRSAIRPMAADTCDISMFIVLANGAMNRMASAISRTLVLDLDCTYANWLATSDACDACRPKARTALATVLAASASDMLPIVARSSTPGRAPMTSLVLKPACPR